MITSAYRFVTNKEIHHDLSVKWVEEVICEFANKHEKRLLNHTNVEAMKLLDTILDLLRRLKRFKPLDLV